MANIIWSESPAMWTAMLGEVPVCVLKAKDIGGCTAQWLDGQLWAAPRHLPRAMAQPTRFFAHLEEAKWAVEQSLLE
jgi:hypothetical protein